MKNLNELTLLEATEGLKNKAFSSVELVEACYTQIERYDSKIKAFVTVVPKNIALRQSHAADVLISEKGSQAFEEKPLLGIPYACKDNYNTKGVETTASSNILKGYIPPYESTVTQRLKDAGAILIGKTNMDAFAHGGSTEQSDFFTTHNPWDISRLPGGSSGGMGAAVAAHMVTFGIGEDTGGSIRCPSSWCGITGLKPTYGRVSRYGVIAMASSTDSPGPMTKTVADTALIMQIIAGRDPLDATSSQKSADTYLADLDIGSLKGLRIGKPASFFTNDMDASVINTVEACAHQFEDMGATIVPIELLSPKYALAVYTIVQRSEVSSNLARFDGIRFGHSRAAFGFEARKRMILGAYVLSVGYYDAYYAKAQKVRTLIINDFKRAFAEVDVILGPTLPTVAQKLGASASSPLFGELIDTLQLPASMSGLPSVAFPCGFVEGLPVGAQLMGPMFAESKVLGAAAMYQKVTDFHTKFPDLSNL